jgi:hypothetical protein
MKSEREKIVDLIIVQFIDPMAIFPIEQIAPSTIKYSVGQIANRVLDLHLPAWANNYPVDELAKLVNRNPKVLTDKIKLAGIGPNPAGSFMNP